MDRGLLLDVVVGKSAVVFQLFASEDETLLIRRNGFLVLDLALQVLDRVRRLHVERDVLSGQGSHEDLHSRGGEVSSGTRNALKRVRGIRNLSALIEVIS